MNISTNEYIKGAIEALLFISERPVMLDQFKEALESVSVAEIKKLVGELQAEYEDQKRGMVVVEIAGGYQMLSSSYYASYIRNFFKTRVKERLSRPALETLAIVAYKQPVSRADIELIRGVNSDGVVTHILNKGLVKIVGRKDVPGRPYLYGTTKEFLEYFGLRSLHDLPKLEDFPALVPAAEAQEQANTNEIPAEEAGEVSTIRDQQPETDAVSDTVQPAVDEGVPSEDAIENQPESSVESTSCDARQASAVEETEAMAEESNSEAVAGQEESDPAEVEAVGDNEQLSEEVVDVSADEAGEKQTTT